MKLLLDQLRVLPSIDEFRLDRDRCARRILRTMALSIGGMLVFVLVAAWASSVSETTLGPVVPRFLPAACFVLGLPLMLFGFWKADQHYKQFATLSCPHCSKSLVQSSQIVIASRNCPHCGRPVVRPPDDPK